MISTRCIVLTVVVNMCCMSIPVAASASGLENTLARLMEILPGEFDSAGQLRAEQATNTPKESTHGHVYRSFIRIDAPALGNNVLVSTVRYGGRDGQFDNGEFQVWTLNIDRGKGAVLMKPQRFKMPATYIANNRNPNAFKDLAASELVPAHGGASCPIAWTPNGTSLRGITDPPCKSRSETMDMDLIWDWAYSLDESGMWINFAGRNDAGDIVNGRADQMPWRLEKLN